MKKEVNGSSDAIAKLYFTSPPPMVCDDLMSVNSL